jgi:hypothetical protein
LLPMDLKEGQYFLLLQKKMLTLELLLSRNNVCQA